MGNICFRIRNRKRYDYSWMLKSTYKHSAAIRAVLREHAHESNDAKYEVCVQWHIDEFGRMNAEVEKRIAAVAEIRLDKFKRQIEVNNVRIANLEKILANQDDDTGMDMFRAVMDVSRKAKKIDRTSKQTNANLESEAFDEINDMEDVAGQATVESTQRSSQIMEAMIERLTKELMTGAASLVIPAAHHPVGTSASHIQDQNRKLLHGDVASDDSHSTIELETLDLAEDSLATTRKRLGDEDEDEDESLAQAAPAVVRRSGENVMMMSF